MVVANLLRLGRIGTLGLLACVPAWLPAQTLAQVATPKLSLGPRFPATPLSERKFIGQYGFSVDPENPANMIVCGARFADDRISVQGFVSSSNDGGETWAPTLLERSSRWVTEESCVFGANSRAYFMAGASNTSWGIDHARGQGLLYRSTDRGRTWEVSARLPFLDWTHMLTGPTPGGGERLAIFANEAADDHFKWGAFQPNVSLSEDGGAYVSPAGGPSCGKSSAGGSYPMAAVSLRDGRSLALYLNSERGEGLLAARNSIRTMVVSAEGAVVDCPSTVAVAPTGTFFADLAVDSHDDRLYAIWIEKNLENTQLILAISADRGNSWHAHPVLRSPTAGRELLALGRPSVAVNRDGQVGVLWPGTGGSCTRFAVSSDHGNSFSSPVELSPCANELQDIDEDLGRYVSIVRPIDEKRVVTAGRSAVKAGAGISFIVNVTQEGRQTSLQATAAGEFVASWAETYRGVDSIWVRKISTAALPADDAANSGFSQDRLTDVSQSIVVELYDAQYDPQAAQFLVDVVLHNRSAKTIDGPLWLELTDLRSDFGAIRPLNSAGSPGPRRYLWRISPAETGSRLPPWQSTARRKLAFSLVRSASRTDNGPQSGSALTPSFAAGLSAETRILSEPVAASSVLPGQ